jgi:HKD family nuclease
MRVQMAGCGGTPVTLRSVAARSNCLAARVAGVFGLDAPVFAAMPRPPRIEILAQPFGGADLGTAITTELERGAWTSFRAAVAFLKVSGLRHVASPLDAFLGAGGQAKLSIGIDHDGTSLEGLQDLWRVINGRAELYVFKEGQGGQVRTFHPKAFLFQRADEAVAIVGSGNWTGGGLFTNHELGLRIELDLTHGDSADVVTALEASLDEWQTPSPACIPVDGPLLVNLFASGDLLSEAAIAAAARAARAAPRQGSARQTAGRPRRFGASGATGLPPIPPHPPAMRPPAVAAPSPPPRRPVVAPAPVTPPTGLVSTGHHALLIEVRPHHNGEIFLSKTAIDDDPGFFGYPFTGWTRPKKTGNRPYPMVTPDPQVEIVVYDAQGRQVVRQEHSLNVVFYSPKSEIRITIPPEPLARIPQLSLLVMSRNPSPPYDYRLDFYPPNCNTPYVQQYRAKLVHALPSGGAATKRRYGWA